MFSAVALVVEPMRIQYCYDVQYTYFCALEPPHGRFLFLHAQTILRQTDCSTPQRFLKIRARSGKKIVPSPPPLKKFNGGRGQIFFFKSTFEVILKYFRRIFRLFWQLLSQIVAPAWPLPQSSRGGGTGAPAPSVSAPATIT